MKFINLVVESGTNIINSQKKKFNFIPQNEIFMKKTLLSIILLLSSLWALSTTYYVSPAGNDATGDGSLAKPWKTVRNAMLNVTASGNTIHLIAGTYTESTSTLNLAAGVNLEGEGVSTIIKAALTGQWSTLLNLESNGVTNGNQRISGITFDGQYVSETNYKTWIGVWVTFRSNVVFDSCVFQNFYNRGLLINGNGDNRSTIPIDPKIYTTGNKVTNCRFLNTGGNDGNTYGQLNIGGTKDALIQNNYMDQTQRPGTKNGECIKYWGSGYNPGLKILNNILKRANHVDNQYNGSNGDWNFAIELFNNTGLEIAGNTIQGSIDLNYNRVVAPYTYSVWIHDNTSDHNPFNQKEEQGIIFEFETSKATVENNKFNNLAMGITFNVRTPSNNGGYNNPKPVGGYSATTDVTIQNNLFTNLYSAFSYGNCCSAAGIQFLTEGGTNDGYVRNLLITNNTFVTKSGNAAVSGLDLTNFTASTASTDGITISKNIFVGFSGQYLEGGSAKMLNTTTQGNDIWQCGNNNSPSWSGSLTNTGNISSNPNFDANYVSPLGIGYNGSGAPPPPNPCTYTYSAWSACVNGQQTRTVTASSPADCTGTPVLTQSCTIPTCTFTYSAWSDCINGVQTRTVLTASPSGCIGTPVLQQTCTSPVDTIYAKVILYGNSLTRKNIVYFVKRSDGYLYDNTGTKRDIHVYQSPAGYWLYKDGDGWMQLF